MKNFAAVISYVDNMVERRAPFRPAHLDFLNGLVAEGKVVAAGAWADPVDGALILYRGDSLEEAEKLCRQDPYNVAGLWTDLKFREWNVVIGSI